MKASVCIEQKGTVEMITEQGIQVKILRNSSCGPCSAKSLCFLGESAERTVFITDCENYLKKGDTVSVMISRSKGNKAVVLGYFIPFLLIMSALITFTILDFPEWISGILSLTTLLPYFIILHLLQNRLNRVFILSAHKME
jgi:sigma-E factor negative regulatory protein RseC